MIPEDLIIAGLDIETTGFLGSDQRIVEVYIGLWRAGKRVFEFNQRINPQRTIPAEATRVHGITLADLAGKPLWEAVAPAVLRVLEKADLYVAHNGDEFDLPFFRQEFTRVGLTMPERPSVDTMKVARWATYNGKNPRLGELCFSLGVPYDPTKAHAADYDVAVMMEAFYQTHALGFLEIPKIEKEVVDVDRAA